MSRDWRADLTGIGRFDLGQISALSRVQREFDIARRSGALRALESFNTLEALDPGLLGRISEVVARPSVLELASGSPALAAFREAQEARSVLTAAFEIEIPALGIAEDARRALSLSDDVTAAARRLAALSTPTVLGYSTRLSARGYRSVADTTEERSQSRKIEYAGHEALGTAEMDLLLTEPEDEALGDHPDVDYSRMPQLLHDDLRSALRELDPRLVDRLDGAWDRATSSGPHAASQAAHSAQELIDHTLRQIAPDDLVLDWHAKAGFDASELNGGRPTRRIRIRYLVRNRPADEDAAADFSKSFTALSAMLQKAKHGDDGDQPRIVGNLLLTLEGYLGFLLVE